MRGCVWFLIGVPLVAQNPAADFFEKKIRPVLAAKCYACHSSKAKAPMGGLTLDTRSGLARVASNGRLLSAVRYENPQLQMPPAGKLGEAVIADFAAWVAGGAHDPRPEEAAAPKAPPDKDWRSWWAFQPLRAAADAPRGSRIDSFIRAQLAASGLTLSQEADRRTLARRLYLNLIGLAPTYEEAEAFANDRAPRAYERLVEQLLASPRYGERWGRYWLDVARFAEDNPTSEATNPPYPQAWRYRDWVIEAINDDLPYPRFVELQLAADLIPGTPREDLRALGYLGAAPIYHKDARLSQEVIETLATDDWDERVDAVTRGLLGLTVACARCHDHKFDPISTRDYYGLAGVFASTQGVLRPVRADMDPAVENRFLWVQQRLIHLDYLAKLLTGEPGTKPEEAREKAVRFRAEIQTLKEEMAALGDRYPEIRQYVARFGNDTPRQRGAGMASDEPFIQAVYEAGLWIDGSDPDLTLMDYRPGTARELPVFLRGSVASPGPPAPRRFLSILSKGDPGLGAGSGRLALARRMFADAAPLAARVMVNRVWGWHFGKPLVATTSDFGSQGERPSHPELLDDLAARWVDHGWSLKWLHREIVLSAAYRQSSRKRAEAAAKDPTNRWLWRMNPRRLDIEAYRDSLLRAARRLDLRAGGVSADLDEVANQRRTVYARISRGRLNPLLRLYDFADPAQHSPGRDLTTTPLQQLFVMNSAFIEEQAAALAGQVAALEDAGDKVRTLYRDVFSRDPQASELDLGISFLSERPLTQYAQALLAANEVIFWP